MGVDILNDIDNTFITIESIMNLIEMPYEGYRRVHISHPGFDIEPTVSPIKEMGADRVYLLASDKPNKTYNEIIKNVKKRLKGTVAHDEIYIIRTHLFDITELMKFFKAMAGGNKKKNVKRTDDQKVKGIKDKPQYKKRGVSGPLLGWAFDEEYRRAELLSANCSASARGLAKLGAYMANKGTHKGKSIMT